MPASTLTIVAIASFLAVFGISGSTAAENASAGMKEGENKESLKTAYDFSFKTIDGEDMPLSQYKGKVVMVVNTASRCGFTPQYEGLQKLYEFYKDKGLVIIGVPANDFAGQEPGSNAEIKKFCSMNYAITFPMTEKTAVSGKDAHPFYKWAGGQGIGGMLASKPRWNFHKYLIDADGKLVGSYGSVTKPGSKEIKKDIEAALARIKPAE